MKVEVRKRVKRRVKKMIEDRRLRWWLWLWLRRQRRSRVCKTVWWQWWWLSNQCHKSMKHHIISLRIFSIPRLIQVWCSRHKALLQLNMVPGDNTFLLVGGRGGISTGVTKDFDDKSAGLTLKDDRVLSVLKKLILRNHQICSYYFLRWLSQVWIYHYVLCW